MGSAVLEHQPRSPRAGTAESRESGRVYRHPAGEIAKRRFQRNVYPRLPGRGGRAPESSANDFLRKGLEVRLARFRKEPDSLFLPPSVTAYCSMSYCPLAVWPMTSVP